MPWRKLLEILAPDETAMLVEQLLHRLLLERIKTLRRESGEITRKKREIMSMINRLSVVGAGCRVSRF